MKFILSQKRFIYKAAVMTFFFAVTYLFFRDNGYNAKKKIRDLINDKWKCLFLGYAAYLFTATVMGRYLKNPLGEVWDGIGFRADTPTLNRDNVKNLIAFIPFTFFYLKAFETDQPVRKAILISFGSSLFIEFSQLVGWLGSFQIADIIHNTISGMLGCMIWYLFKWLQERFWKVREIIGDKKTDHE